MAKQFSFKKELQLLVLSLLRRLTATEFLLAVGVITILIVDSIWHVIGLNGEQVLALTGIVVSFVTGRSAVKAFGY